MTTQEPQKGTMEELDQLILAHITIQSGFHAGNNTLGELDEAGEKIKAHFHHQLQKARQDGYNAGLADGTGKPLLAIEQMLQKAREETEKAYGGCHYCYGKGYGTQTAAWVGRGYYKKLPTMTFCTCERGKQLEQLLHSELNQDINK